MISIPIWVWLVLFTTSGVCLGGTIVDLLWRRRLRKPTHRHKATGGDYVSFGDFRLTHWPEDTVVDGITVTAYRRVKDGMGWAQPSFRFNDGRFEKLK